MALYACEDSSLAFMMMELSFTFLAIFDGVEQEVASFWRLQRRRCPSLSLR